MFCLLCLFYCCCCSVGRLLDFVVPDLDFKFVIGLGFLLFRLFCFDWLVLLIFVCVRGLIVAYLFMFVMCFTIRYRVAMIYLVFVYFSCCVC